MAKIIEHKKFVCADALNNNNKFWEYERYDDGNVVVKYGRVGKTCTIDPPKQMSETALNAKIREKTRARGKEGTPTYKPPYKEIQVVTDGPTGPTGPSLSKTVVQTAAISQLAGNNPTLTNLVTRLVAANKHELYKASGGQMDIDLSTGIISTPVGVITKDTVSSARKVLNILDPLVVKQNFDDTDFIKNLNDYLMLVPQAVGHARGWHRTFFNSRNTLQSQNILLDQLETSADLAEARLAAASKTATDNQIAAAPSIFSADLKVLEDLKMIAKIKKMYSETINQQHVSKNLKPINFYEVTLPEAKAAFDSDGAKLDNIWMLWHGTRMFNVLSILKNSLFCPPCSGSFHVTGRMFGDGIYGSDQSTKALNYAYGYWDGGPRDTNCFMFLVDFAMGTHYTPKSSYETLPKKGYDSTFAKAHESGVMNNEMIVYRNSQVNIRYLVEFG